MPREVPEYISRLGMGSMPTVSYTNAPAEFTKGVSKELGQLGAAIQNKELEIATINADTEMKTEIQRISEANAGNPEAMKSGLDGYRKGLAKKLPAAIRDRALNQWDTYSLTHVGKATETFKDNQDQRIKMADLTSINADIEALKTSVDSVESDIPEHQAGGYRALGGLAQKIEALAARTDHNGRLMYSPEQIVSLQNRADDIARARMERNRLAPIEKELQENPAGLIDKINKGEISFKDDKEKEKYLKEGVSKFKDNEERGQIMRVIDAAVKDRGIYEQFVNNDPEILNKIEDYKENGGNSELADYMRKQALKANPVSAGEQDRIYTEVIDEVSALQISTKQGKIKIGKDDATLEEVARLQGKIMKASIGGVTGLDSQLKKLSPALVELAKKERGKDDLGADSFFGFFRATEAYDPGYEKIQKYLEGQDKDKDYAAKAGMMREFVNLADQIPEEIQKDDALFEQAQEKMAQVVIARQAGKGMKNIPVSAIQHLVANPGLKKQFDEKFGTGAANRVLGR